jgi:Protein of unknown function (DUF3795)
MYDMTAYCGLDCLECQAYKATKANDLQLKKQIAERWSSQDEIKFKPEDIDCLGCKSDVISGWLPKALQGETVRWRKEYRYLCSM